jgi:hypothetical protein
MLIFDKNKRESLLESFLGIQKNIFKWRVKELVSMQIDKIAVLYDQDIVFEFIMPLAFKLCQDTNP